MSQKRLTEYYSDCKKPSVDGSRAKRRKIMVDETHFETSTRNKRQSRHQKQVTAVLHKPEFETPQKGFHFNAFVSDSSSASDGSSATTSVSSAKKRLVLKPSPKRKLPKETEPVVFTFVGNSESSSSDSSLAISISTKMNSCNWVTESTAVLKDNQLSVNESISLLKANKSSTADIMPALKTNKSSTADNVPALKVNKPSTPNSTPVLESANSEMAGKEASSTTVDCNKVKKNPGKVTATEIKAKLSKCGGLAELKQRLKEFDTKKIAVAAKVATNIEKSLAKDLEEKGQEKLAEVYGIVNNHRVQENTAEAVFSSAKPAYERYHSLAVPVPPTLILPLSYQVLRDLFTSADTTVSMLDKRNEICTFQKLSDAVQSMTKRAFGMKQLGQIKTVYPSAYVFRQERHLHKSGARTSEYQLTIQANLDGGSNAVNPSKDKVTKVSRGNVKQNVGESEPESERSVFTLNRLLERRTVFFTNLINIIKKYHRDFLEKLGVASSCTDDKILRWHPKFNVDSVPVVEPAELPKPPEDDKVLRTASDVLKQASRSQRQLNPVLQRALEKVSAAKAVTTSDSSVINHVSPLVTNVVNRNLPSTSSVTAANQNKSTPAQKSATPSVKGIPQSLLEKIRAKEALMQECAMVRSEEKDKRIVMLERLPELIRILRGEFVVRKKPALLMRECCQRITDSYKSRLSSEECESHIRLMAEIAPELVTITKISSGVYVKFDINIPLTTICDKISKLQKQSLLE